MTVARPNQANRLPDPGAGFFWDVLPGSPDAPVLRPDLDPRSTRLRAAFTTRVGGVSESAFRTLNVSFAVGDDPDDVRTNRAIAGEAVGAGGRWSVVKQVHGGDVARASPGPLLAADAVWTSDANDPVAVLSADCVLMLVVGGASVGCAHAGWRGLVAGIAENAMDAVDAKAVFAGPAIGPCCFEVGPDVARAFSERFGDEVLADRRHVDLWRAAEVAVRRRPGVSFYSSRICTSCSPDLFFSHRRDRGTTGRQALLARIDLGA